MLGALQQPYIFAIVLAVVTAVLAYLLSTVTDKDAVRSKRTFFKTLAAGVVAGLALTYFTTGRARGGDAAGAAAVVTEPFDAIAGATAGPVGI